MAADILTLLFQAISVSADFQYMFEWSNWDNSVRLGVFYVANLRATSFFIL